MTTRYRLEDLPAELRNRIVVNPFTGCWEWQHTRHKAGVPDWDRYAFTKWEGRTESLHRLVYGLLAGPLDPGLQIDHVYALGCRSKSCCWPAHLEQVTGGQNTGRAKRGRTGHGVARTIQKRLAYGRPTIHDLTLADAAWMLPAPEVAEALDAAAARRAAEMAAYEARPVALFDTRRAAELLGETKEQLERRRKDGTGPFCFRITPKKWVYQRCDLDEWIATQKVSA